VRSGRERPVSLTGVSDERQDMKRIPRRAGDGWWPIARKLNGRGRMRKDSSW
jgi:hypothetical protein